MYTITYTPRDLRGETGNPALLIHADGRGFIFHGGYGESGYWPSQDSCRLLARWCEPHGITETPLSLTAALDAARRAGGVGV